MALISAHQRHLTPTKYEDYKEDDDEEVRPQSHIHRIHEDKKTSFSSLAQKVKALFTSHPGASLTFSMFIK